MSDLTYNSQFSRHKHNYYQRWSRSTAHNSSPNESANQTHIPKSPKTHNQNLSHSRKSWILVESLFSSRQTLDHSSSPKQNKSHFPGLTLRTPVKSLHYVPNDQRLKTNTYSNNSPARVSSCPLDGLAGQLQPKSENSPARVSSGTIENLAGRELTNFLSISPTISYTLTHSPNTHQTNSKPAQHYQIKHVENSPSYQHPAHRHLFTQLYTLSPQHTNEYLS